MAVHSDAAGATWPGDPPPLDSLHSNANYGLPDQIYGVEIEIEHTVKVTSERGAAVARSYAWPDESIALVFRQGELDGVYGERSFSTFTMFHDLDMEVQERSDTFDDLWQGRVVEETAEVLTCPASGYLITAATAS